MGGNQEQNGTLDTVDQYFINYDKWITITLRLKHKVQDFTLFPLADYRILVIGGKHEQEDTKAFDIIDLKPYVLTELHDLNRECKFTAPIFGTAIKMHNKIAFVKNYCDTEPNEETFITFNHTILNEF